MCASTLIVVYTQLTMQVQQLYTKRLVMKVATYECAVHLYMISLCVGIVHYIYSNWEYRNTAKAYTTL